MLVFLLSGCSGSKLDQQVAARMLQSHFRAGESSIVVRVGRVGAHCVYVENGQEHEIDIAPEEDVNAIVGMKAGYLTAAPDGAGFWKIDLTGKGNAARDSYWSNGDVHNDRRGCVYRYAGFVLARPELVGITRIGGDAKTPDVDYRYKWVPTELGAALSAQGAIYSQLKDSQKTLLHARKSNSAQLEVPLPVPPESQLQSGVAKFAKTGDGWQLVTSRVLD